ncbi:putative lipoxygenase [Aspergillus campestris IBT 28561]|uniref:Manganese lipoxygenase n=1 Tax=Aspergillus campestris (strain IBT 28561) TaxID=1392248 RepID=A0A2I1D5M3_ASPC2|nr:putative lipoxygenase [Aspergillus campestris IBT 28561]PKY05176.1 putative lipoxygenase [Aspergillus campestris IBT 28561]
MVRNLSALEAGPDNPDTPRKWPKDPREVVANDLDAGALVSELAKLNLLPKMTTLDPPQRKAFAMNPERTYRGTRLALTKVYDLIEQRYMAFTDMAQLEPSIPVNMTKEYKQKFFVFTKSKDDSYPPHINLGLNRDWAENDEEDWDNRSDLGPWSLFDLWSLPTLLLIMKGVVPTYITGEPYKGNTIAEVEKYQKNARENWYFKDIFDRSNVGDLKDWYSDARFSQQQFTGTNPTTIERTSNDWIDHFIRAAKTPDDAVARETIAKLSTSCRESFYVQDYSYFRKAAGMESAADIKCEGEANNNNEKSYRYGCASVCLFFLNENGQLYPLAIVIDWRGSLEKSVTIYNRELFKRTNIRSGSELQDRKDETTEDHEKTDWPWRYAKTCVQCSDWFRHEVTVHLTRTHLIEESIIVSANRQFDSDHPVFEILHLHWKKTLALNGAARGTLVPSVILQIIGFKQDEALAFIRDEYRTFDFQNSYVPRDLRRRGFPPEDLDSPKFHNYAYARCINSMWKKIRDYVEARLSLAYPEADADTRVKKDACIQEWCKEMRSPDGADLREFPSITTFAELVDCVTMCIHIASPQHSAVNYLQDYYQDFVINKPSCLFEKPPNSLEDLLQYTETDLVKALPMNRPHEWLLSSHVPYLLSFPPQEEQTLMACVHSAWTCATSHPPNPKLAAVLNDFYQALYYSDDEFEKYSKEKDDYEDIDYSVLKTDKNAVSILI